MNARRRLQREIIRHRRAEPWHGFTRITTPNGKRMRVYVMDAFRCPLHTAHADYQGRMGWTYAPWPPTPDTLRELGRWA